MRRVLVTALFMISVFSAGTVLADAGWSKMVRDEIFNHLNKIPTGGSYELDVEARGGTVWLRGAVANEQVRSEIERIAKEQEGVTDVINQLRISNTKAVAVGDEKLDELKTEVAQQLVGIGYTLECGLSDNTLHLSGEMPNDDAVQKVLSVASRVFPSYKIVNKLSLIKIPDQEIRSEILQEIAREKEISIEGLNVFVKDGVVTVSGLADNHPEADYALAVIQMIDGVKRIDSKLTIAGGYKWDGR